MTQEHAITPPDRLIHQWIMEATEPSYVPTQAARWGADQQLEQDARWLDTCALFSEHLTITPSGDALRQAMRPKPPSLKEQALALIGSDFENQPCLSEEGFTILRRALESLPND
jgi:hypothetical protein